MRSISTNTYSATRWATLAESDTAILEDYRALYASTSGNIVIDDMNDNTVTFAVSAGQILPVQAKRLTTATTATVIGLG